MNDLWQKLVERSPAFVLFAILPTVVVNVTWLVGSAACLAMDHVDAIRKYKIQPRDNGTVEFWRCLRHSLKNKLLSEVPLTFAAYPLFVALGVSTRTPLPGAAAVLATLAFCLVVEDAWHYFAHRTLHTRWGFKKVHYLHHHYTTPFGIASSYAHPAETIFTGFGTVLPILILRPHLFTMLLWVMTKQLQAIAVHSGYQFPWRPSRFLPFLVSAGFHDRHHRRFNRNYAPNFVWLDRLLGTADERELGPRARGAPEMAVIAEE
jgi:methylsterol monooxygenase